jgi:hypothetical protein
MSNDVYYKYENINTNYFVFKLYKKWIRVYNFFHILKLLNSSDFINFV